MLSVDAKLKRPLPAKLKFQLPFPADMRGALG